MKLSIMLEGQNGLNWGYWKDWAAAVEELGFYGLYRSDHFTNVNPPDKDSLELWVSLTYLAATTKRIRFGPLVTPLSFRHPAHISRMAGAVDDLSGGRLKLGLGAGWQEREHNNYGFDLLSIKPRFERFEEGLEIIRHFLKEKDRFAFTGKYFKMNDVEMLPHPKKENGVDILIGGNGKQLTLPLVVKYADEWNAVYISEEGFSETASYLDQLMVEAERPRESLRRSLMTNLTYAINEDKMAEKLAGRTTDSLRSRGLLVGNPEEVIKQIKRYDTLGVEEIMLQWLDLDDLEGLEHFAKNVLPVFC